MAAEKKEWLSEASFRDGAAAAFIGYGLPACLFMLILSGLYATHTLPAIGFGLASIFAVIRGCSLPEFCWSTWLAGLFYSRGCIAAASLQIILSARSAKPAYDERFPFLRRISPAAFLIIMTGISMSVGIVMAPMMLQTKQSEE